MRWVAVITYVETRSRLVYVAFIVDNFSRTIVGWRISLSLRTEFAPVALEQAIWVKPSSDKHVHHSDHDFQCPSVRDTERLVQEVTEAPRSEASVTRAIKHLPNPSTGPSKRG